MKPKKILQNRQKKESDSATLLKNTTNRGKNAEKWEQISD